MVQLVTVPELLLYIYHVLGVLIYFYIALSFGSSMKSLVVFKIKPSAENPVMWCGITVDSQTCRRWVVQSCILSELGIH